MKNLWNQCRGEHYIQKLKLKAWRAVEAQYDSYTRHLVDTEKEHEVLEDLIEKNKPRLPYNELQDYHYLLSTPFRYPPLEYGSRFAATHEISIWYGSKEIETTLSERAYYDFLFTQHSEGDLIPIQKSYTVFSIQIMTQKGVDLTKKTIFTIQK